MCGIYSNADPILYESRTRSLRIHGVITTVRLENLFWDVLCEIAACESMTTSQFAVKLYDELIALRGEPPSNFASFLRVCCLRYLSMRADKGADREADRGTQSGAGVADAMPALVLATGEATRPRVLKTV
ncbi:ribbon-helix-helix domain-containing protein [Paraburkholderia sp. ZP32-5]|uniref:ribbon-helix-helix domain-containing protein n=1 Tax=Paraburkholderia sp. ZP32-5 TaxID=2883245 RepID=UPI001F190ACD|nr:ribbon-helix-helix domain-containing protein [Paraburkholderia sp. ZP32-5]